MEVWDSIVIGAGQGGLAASHFLTRRGVHHLVLDANPAPGGAWQHRWDSLTMHDVHGVADLPGLPAPARSAARAYTREHGEDDPAIAGWTWDSGFGPGGTQSMAQDTGDNE